MGLDAAEGQCGIRQAQVFYKEAGGICAPSLGEGETDVGNDPYNDSGVINCDNKSAHNLPPAEPFKAFVDSGPSSGSTAFVGFPDGIFQNQNRNTGGNDNKEVGEQESPTTVGCCDIRKTPTFPRPTAEPIAANTKPSFEFH